MTLPGLLVWTLVSGTALADPTTGILVRLEAEGQLFTESPVIELTPTSGGDAVRVVLSDGGAAPDVVANDGQWAGVALQDARSIRVRAILNGETKDGGSVSWEDGANSRELTLSDGWTGLQSHAGVATTGSHRQVGQKAAARREEKRGSGTRGRSTEAASVASATARGWVDWLPLAGGLICLLIGAGLGIRNSRPPIRPMRLARLPEPPILGPGTPALHQGLSLWKTTPEDRDTITTALLRTMATHHRVLLVHPQSAVPPTALGGPVYRTTDATPARVEDHLIDLFERPGLPVSVLFVVDAPSTGDIAAYRSLLEPDVGGILLYTGPVADQAPDIEVEHADHRIVLRAEGHSIPVSLTDQGLAPR
jgi:hypothetical protein